MNALPPGPQPTPQPDSKRVNPALVWITTGAFYALGIVLALLIHYETPKDSWDWSWTLLSAVVLDFLLSWRSVGETELGATFFFGKPVGERDPGPVFAPWLIIKLRTDSRDIIEIEIPGEPEEVQKYDEDNIRPGMKAPVRINQAAPETALFYDENGENPKHWRELDKKEQDDVKLDPLSRRLTTEVSGIVRFRIRPGNYIQFLQITGSMKKAKANIEDMWVSTVQTMLGQVTPSHAIARKGTFDKKLKDAVEILVGEKPNEKGVICQAWGIEVQNAPIKLIDTGKTVNQAIANATAEDFRRQGIVSLAEAERVKEEQAGKGRRSFLENEGKGEASKIKDTLTAQAEGMGEIAKIARTKGGIAALSAETLQKGMQGAQYTVIGPDSIVGTIASIKEVLMNIGSGVATKK